MKKLLAIFLLLVAGGAQAEVYTWTNGRGTVFYTNSIYEIPKRYLSKAKLLDVATGKKTRLTPQQLTGSAPPAKVPEPPPTQGVTSPQPAVQVTVPAAPAPAPQPAAPAPQVAAPPPVQAAPVERGRSRMSRRHFRSDKR